MSALLTARNLSHAYGATRVFDGVDLTVTAGQRLAVLGASGSGKTTLLRIIAGLTEPSGGKIERAPNLGIGMVFQDLALWPNLTALQNVSFVLSRVPRRQRTTIAMEALEKCRIAELAHRPPSALSVGQQQRLALARAFACRPSLLLLDEPFCSLDLVLKSELFEVVRAITADATLILVTHDPLEAIALCDTALVLESGAVGQSGPLSTILQNPTSRLLRAFVDASRR